MLSYPFKDFEEFKTIFQREDGTRKNRILLAYLKSKEVRKWIFSQDVLTFYEKMLYSNPKSMDDLKAVCDYLVWKFRDEECRGRGYIYLPYNNKSIKTRFYNSDSSDGICEDRDWRSYRYVNIENRRTFKMRMGKMMRNIILESPYGRLLPESVVLWLCEEHQRDWETFARRKMPDNNLTLHVGRDFDKIYNSVCLFGDFHSCMTNRGTYGFYKDAVKAEAAYLTNQSGLIVSRCVIYTHVEDTETGEIYRLAERQYSSGDNEILKRDLVDKLIQGGYIDGYKRVGADCHSPSNFIDKDGKSLSDKRFAIDCNLNNGDSVSYQDSFKWYDDSIGRAYNFEADDAYYKLDITDGAFHPEGENYDEYHDAYTSSDLVEVHYGRWMMCSEDDLDDFYWIEDANAYYHEDEVGVCPYCDSYYVYDDGYYSDIVESDYCCRNCRDSAEREYKEDCWHYSSYDGEYYEDEDEVVTIYYNIQRTSYDTIHIDSLSNLVDNGDAVLVNDEYYDIDTYEEMIKRGMISGNEEENESTIKIEA